MTEAPPCQLHHRSAIQIYSHADSESLGRIEQLLSGGLFLKTSFSDPGLKVTSGYADHLAICQFFFASPASFKFNLETASRVTYLYYKCNCVIYYQKYFTSFSQPACMLKTELFCLENKIFHNMLSVSCCDTLCALNYLELPKHF